MTVNRKHRKVDVDRARVLREQGLSYSDVAQRMNVSPGGVYAALNRERRVEARDRVEARSRAFYCKDVLWETLHARAGERFFSTSELIVRILLGVDPPIVLEPVIPVTVEGKNNE